VKERKRRLKAWNRGAHRNQVLDDGNILVIKAIVDANPNYYLDEIAFDFDIETGTSVNYSTIRRCLLDKLGYSMQVLQTIAKQQCEVDKIIFLQAMELYLQSYPDRLITIDETHKD